MFFTKMHGLGNNYVVFNQLDEPENILEEHEYPDLSRYVSDVNFGIGSDGIILICSSNIADFKMRIFNEDGSEAKNCGNGLRCVAKYLYDHMYAKSPRFSIETRGGVVNVEIEEGFEQRQSVQSITVDMGEPKLLKSMIPMKGDPFSITINEPYTFDGNVYYLTCVSMGNPHAIIFVDDVNAFPLEKLGPIIENSSLFPERINVGIVQVKGPKELDYRVWERGSGMTMACGTGACAAVVAATMNQYLEKYEPIIVHLPGGDLTIRWDEKGHVWKKGEADYICHGELKYSKNKLKKLGS
ncbi:MULTISPECIES: diaminopimelate epimerase [Bacillaceae]|jgi:diaminopimelate epimerase|nr:MULTISPECIES: diaminopimelate epimerase [Bacillaceae]MCU9601490.1 diaminopimelate epimerase [Pallidibacillus thermolactis subsp. kokeshiiformis]MED1673556.1 diaminopimelate epimerase [Pallidibacillus thermolactis subsp. kokeshiiformis]